MDKVKLLESGTESINSAFHVAKEDGILYICIFLLFLFAGCLIIGLSFWKGLIDSQKKNIESQTEAIKEIPVLLRELKVEVSSNKSHNSLEHGSLSSENKTTFSKLDYLQSGVDSLRDDFKELTATVNLIGLNRKKTKL